MFDSWSVLTGVVRNSKTPQRPLNSFKHSFSFFHTGSVLSNMKVGSSITPKV